MNQNEAELIFIDFEVVLNFSLRQLYDIEPSPLSILIAIDHIHSIPQFKGRCRLDSATITLEKINQIGIEGINQKDIEKAIEEITDIFSYNNKTIRFSNEFIERMKNQTEQSTTIILRINNTKTNQPPIPSEIQRERQSNFDYANNLFGDGMKNIGYDFKQGNDVVNLIFQEQKINLQELCKWREERKRPKLEPIMKLILKEWEIYKKPKHIDGLKPKEKKQKSYKKRERSLSIKKEENNND